MAGKHTMRCKAERSKIAKAMSSGLPATREAKAKGKQGNPYLNMNEGRNGIAHS